MASCNKPGFSGEVHLHIKYQMTRDLLLTWQSLARQTLFNGAQSFFKRQDDMCHLLSNRISPQFVAVFVIKLLSFSNSARYLDTKLLSSAKILGLVELGEYPLMLTQDRLRPPCKCQLLTNTISNSIFGSLDGIRILKILESNPS